MNQIKLLSWIVGLLLLINLGTLGFLLIRPGNQLMPPPGRPATERAAEKLLIKKLQLNQDQVMQFRRLRGEHQKGMMTLNQQLNQSYRQLFSLLKERSVTDEQKNQILKQIEGTHTAINNLHLSHFENIKAFCKEEQVIYFNDFVEEMSIRFVPKNPPPPKRE